MIDPQPLPGGADDALLVVHAHPDDETLATGALLATWAAAGRPVTLVTCTRGEQGEVIGTSLAHLEGDSPALAAHREQELTAALAALGVTDHLYLDALSAHSGRFEDSGMTWLDDGAPGTGGRAGAAGDPAPGSLVAGDLDEQADLLAGLVRERRPSVVVTYEPGGGYGHPDHVRAHDLTMRAVRRAASPSGDRPGHVVGEIWWPVVPAPELRAARAELAGAVAHLDTHVLLDVGRTAVVPDPAGPLPSVAGEHGTPDVAIDVRPVLAAVGAALREHATQVQGVTEHHDGTLLVGWYALSNDVLVPWLRSERYVRASIGTQGSSGDGR